MYFKNLGNVIVNNNIISSKQIREKIEIVKKNLNVLVKKNDVVGILGPRTEETIIVILSCLELNITFIPMEIELPEERLKFMIKDGGVKYLINGIAKSEQCVWINDIVNISYQKLFKDSNCEIYEDTCEENPAYILYTSGTTGRPKGVIIPYGGLVNFLNAIPKKIPFLQGRSISCFTSFAFDISLMEIVLGLMSGLNLILATNEERNNPKSIIGLIERYNIEMLQMTPSMLKLLQVYNGDFSFLKCTEILMLGGEKLSDELLINVQKETNCRIFNMYGPTETTIWSTVSELTNKSRSDIGTPIAGTTIYLVNEKNELVKNGDEGELLIGGKGVAEGYVNCTELTNERFITIECLDKERVYKTGDICKYDESGNLLFVSRKDSQIKHNGHRIELTEIEHCINELKMVTDNCVCFDGKDIFCFYLVDNKEIEYSEINKRLSLFLPNYMIPDHYIKVDKFEYTISRKIDRKKLLEKYKNTQEICFTGFDTEETSLESVEDIVKKIISKKVRLPIGDLMSERALDELGIDSVEFIEMVVEIEDYFGIGFDEEYLNIDRYHIMQDLIEYIDSRIIKQKI